jgi:hypothetical protein
VGDYGPGGEELVRLRVAQLTGNERWLDPIGACDWLRGIETPEVRVRCFGELRKLIKVSAIHLPSLAVSGTTI